MSGLPIKIHALNDRRHSLKLQEYIPQLFSFGDIARIRGGQVISAMGKLSAKVGKRKACATSAGSKPINVVGEIL